MVQRNEAHFVIHKEPAWRERANFIINARLPDRPDGYEQLWSRRVADDQFELCCIPFFLYDVALGDVVRTVAEGEWKYLVSDVARPSDRATFRIWFNNPSDNVEVLTQELTQMGALLEWSSPRLLALDAEHSVLAQRLAALLSVRAAELDFDYEVGRA